MLAHAHVPASEQTQDLDASFKAAYRPLRVGTDLDNPSAPNFRVSALDTARDVPPERLLDRRQLLERIETPASPCRQTAAGTNLHRFQERAVELVTGPEARRARSRT